MNLSASRFWLAGIMALVLHAVFLCWPLSVATIKRPVPLSMKKITVSLHSRKPVTRKRLEPVKPEQKTEKKKEVQAQQQPLPQKVISAPPEVAVSEKKLVVLPVPSVTPVEDQSVGVTVAEAVMSEPVAVVEKGQIETASRVVQQATPLYQVNPPPEYPRLARRRGLEGVVVVAVRVDAAGHVQELEIVTASGHKILDQAASKAVRYWLFRPGTINGQPEEMWVNVPVRFQLR